MTTQLNKWAKKNGFNPRFYSDKELEQLRQTQFQIKHSGEWNDELDNVFYKCCKKHGFQTRVER